jgi:pimeloyl-ACP methyl ester carboxylesterase
MLQAAGEYSADEFLATVDVPTLVIAGEGDTFTPYRLAQAMAAVLPKGQFVMIPGATHAAPLEHRELVAERVAEFIASAVEPAR